VHHSSAGPELVIFTCERLSAKASEQDHGAATGALIVLRMQASDADFAGVKSRPEGSNDCRLCI
jgi:hypothetical protein